MPRSPGGRPRSRWSESCSIGATCVHGPHMPHVYTCLSPRPIGVADAPAPRIRPVAKVVRPDEVPVLLEGAAVGAAKQRLFRV